MSYPFGITGIGNGLGSFGLGGSGSYYDPTMSMGMMNTMGALNPMGINPMDPSSSYMMGGMMNPMMGMYNPTFMSQMTQTQQNIEKMQLDHTGAMHNLMLQNQTKAFTDEDRAIFEKAMVDAAVNKGVINLATMVRKGDADGICQAFDELKQTLYNKYSDYFKANLGKMDPSDSVTNFIEILYSKIISEPGQEPVSLRNEIQKYGETAFEHGFWKNLHGKDYHDKYSEEAVSYVFGTPLDNKAGKDRMEKVGAWTEKIVEGGLAYGAGRAAGFGIRALNPFGVMKLGLKGSNRLSKLVGAIALGGDILWQMSR